jgi:hypothetical protein
MQLNLSYKRHNLASILLIFCLSLTFAVAFPFDLRSLAAPVVDFVSAGKEVVQTKSLKPLIQYSKTSFKNLVVPVVSMVKDPKKILFYAQNAGGCVATIGEFWATKNPKLLADDFMNNGSCYKFNQMCAQDSDSYACPDLSGVRSKLQKVCKATESMGALETIMNARGGSASQRFQEVKGYCQTNGSRDFSQADANFGQTDAGIIQAGVMSSQGNSDAALQALLSTILKSQYSTNNSINQLSANLDKSTQRVLSRVAELDLSIKDQFQEFKQFFLETTDARFRELIEISEEMDERINSKLDSIKDDSTGLRDDINKIVIPELDRIIFDAEEKNKVLDEIGESIETILKDYRVAAEISEAEKAEAEKKLRDYISSQSTRIVMLGMRITQCNQSRAIANTCLLNPLLPMCKSVTDLTPVCNFR